MPRNPRCWANVLDECAGKVSAEHLLPTTVWEVQEGEAPSRENRLKRRLNVTMRAEGEPLVRRELSVSSHTAKILCERHNSATSDLDAHGGLLAEHIRQLFDVHQERLRYPEMRWAPRTFRLSGLLTERWLLKVAVNNLFGAATRIGGAEAEQGWPTSDLVRIIMGQQSPGTRRMFSLSHTWNAGDRYRLAHFERNGTHAGTFVLSYGMFHFGVQLEDRAPSAAVVGDHPHLRGASVVQPVISMRTARTNVELRFDW